MKQVVSMIEADYGKTNVVSWLSTDGAGENTSLEVDKYCKSKGIQQRVSAPYSQAQDGVPERAGRSVFEMVRTMLTLWSTEKSVGEAFQVQFKP